MERIRLDEIALQIHVAEQLPEHRPLVVAGGGVAGLTDRHAQGGGVEGDLGNERRATTGCGLNGTPQGLAITNQLIRISCSAWDLSNRPVTDRTKERCHADLVEEVAERGIRRRSP
jgi:hypothetical protein